MRYLSCNSFLTSFGMNRRQRIDESNGRVFKSTANDTQADQNECIGIFSNPTLFPFSRWAVLFAEDLVDCRQDPEQRRPADNQELLTISSLTSSKNDYIIVKTHARMSTASQEPRNLHMLVQNGSSPILHSKTSSPPRCDIDHWRARST